MTNIENTLRDFWTAVLHSHGDTGKRCGVVHCEHNRGLPADAEIGSSSDRAAAFALLPDDAIPHPPTRPRDDGQSPCCYAAPRAVECCNEPAAHGSAHCEEHRPKYKIENLPNGGVTYALVSGSPVKP